MNPHFPRARLKVSATDRLYLKPSMRCARTAKTMVSLCDRSWSPSGGGAAGPARRDPVGPPTAARRSNVSLGEPGSPTPPPAGGFGRATPSRRGMGKPGFPIPPPAGRCGRAQPVRRGVGKPGFPVAPPGGRVWEGAAIPRITCFHPVRVRRSRMDSARLRQRASHPVARGVSRRGHGADSGLSIQRPSGT